jgi:phosphate starvation-inducible protein PhoH
MVENPTDTQTSIEFANIDLARQLFGEHNNNLRKIAKETDVKINARGNTIFQSLWPKLSSTSFTGF